ncbi:MAG: SGNH/GDSL hydrolase family protein [Calditrichia bacterium]
MPKQIRVSELEDLLLKKDLSEEKLLEYFELSTREGQMCPTLVLRDDVELLDDSGGGYRGGVGGGIMSMLMRLANSWKRRQRLAKLREQLIRRPESLMVVSEGDSWFQHPLICDVIDHLIDDQRFDEYAIRSLGAAGDTIIDMVNIAEYVTIIERTQPRFFLLSAGGNDVIGDEFPEHIKDYSAGEPPENLIKRERLNHSLAKLRNHYSDIIEQVLSTHPGVQIIGHTYSYAGKKRGGWMAKHFDDRNIPEEMRPNIVKIIIDDFREQVMQSLKELFPDKFDYVDARPLLPIKELWEDEIHPSDEGAFKVASAFHEKMQELLNA